MKFVRGMCLPVALLMLSPPAYATLVTFSSLGAFTIAAPGLPVETFESGLVAAGGGTICIGPLSSAAASGCFPAGGLLPGAVYSSDFPIGDPHMVVLGAGFDGLSNTSKVLGPADLDTTFILTFTGVTAVGFDVYLNRLPDL